MLMLILMVMLFVLVVRIGLSLAWGTVKFLFGLGLFCLCPILFLAAVLLGAFTHLWLPILIVGLLLGGGFRRTC